MDTDIICPLGSECEGVKDNKHFRCAWYTQMAGILPDGEDVNESRCDMNWATVMLTENAKQIRAMTEATESFRNESVKGQQQFINLMAGALKKSRNIIE